MNQTKKRPFTHAHILRDDGAVTFACSDDAEAWPWLVLDPHHPIFVQTINFWASIEVSATRGTFDTTKWSALTETEWTCGVPAVGPPTHGVATFDTDDQTPRYALRFFDAHDRLVHRMSGTGVVFETRDFEAWRDKTRAKMGPPTSAADFTFAVSDAVGVDKDAWSFVSPLTDGDRPHVTALIDATNGFPPSHPYLSGSGDHVNSTHLVEAARQFAQLLTGGSGQRIVGGDMTFTCYVELGHVFCVALTDQTDDVLSMAISQRDRPCTTVTLRLG